MAGYLGLTLASVGFQNPDPVPSLYNLYDRVFVPMCLYLIVRLSRFGDGGMRWLVAVAFFMVVSQSTIGILSWVAPGSLPNVWLDKAGARTVGSLVNTSIYTTTLVFSGLLMLHVSQNSRAGLIPALFRLLFVLAMYCVGLSLSRASWIAGALVLMGTLYVYPRFTFRLLIASFAAVVLLGGTLLADQLVMVEARLYSEEAERSALSRLPVSYAAYRMFESSPIFGWGYGTFDLYDRAFYDQVLELPNDQKDHASHNSYLTIIAEQGVTGLLLFLAPMLWLLTLTARRLHSLPAEGLWSRKLVIVLWLTVLSHVVVNNFANMQVVFGLGLWWIILGLVAGLLDASDPPQGVDRATPDPRPGATT